MVGRVLISIALERLEFKPSIHARLDFLTIQSEALPYVVFWTSTAYRELEIVNRP